MFRPLLIATILAPLALAEFSDVFSILEDGACRSCLLDIYNPCAAADKYSESLTGAFSECVCGSAGEDAAKSCREKSCTDTIGGLSVDTFYNTWCLNSNQGFREDKCALTDREFEFYVTNAGPALTTACDALRRADEDEAATGQGGATPTAGGAGSSNTAPAGGNSAGGDSAAGRLASPMGVAGLAGMGLGLWYVLAA